MTAYQIDDMTCGRCADSISRAIRSVDANAKVDVDLRRRLVRVESAMGDASAFREAIRAAGYTAVAAQTPVLATKPHRSGGCCGCCG